MSKPAKIDKTIWDTGHVVYNNKNVPAIRFKDTKIVHFSKHSNAHYERASKAIASTFKVSQNG